MKIYIAGKVSKESSFGKHHWRDEFTAQLENLSGKKLQNLDPLKHFIHEDSAEDIFGNDCRLIYQADVVVVYLSDDISVGGSQEILIAKYMGKPVIGYAPIGGKFNGSRRELLGKIIEDFKDPFVFMTCDVVAGTVVEVADALKTIQTTQPKTLDMLDRYMEE